MTHANLVDALRTAIRETGHNANALSVHSGVSRAIIGRFMRGERTVTLETAAKILAAMGGTVTIGLPDEPTLTIVKKPHRRKTKKGGKRGKTL